MSELIGPSKRELGSIAAEVGLSSGIMTASLLAYHIPDWRVQTKIIGSLYFLNVVLLYAPRSFQNAYGKGHIYAGSEYLRAYAERLNVPLCQKMIKAFEYHNFLANRQRQRAAKLSNDKSLFDINTPKRSRESIFAKGHMVMMTTCCMVCGFTIYTVISGYMLMPDGQHFSHYISTVINESFGILTMFFCYFFMNRFGRRSTLMSFFGMSIICAILAALLDNWERYDISQWVNFVAIAISIGSSCIFFAYLPEIIPTTVRVNGIGFVSVISRGGGILAPLLLHMARSESTWYIAYLVFAVFSTLALLATMFLPETAKYSLPNNVHDATIASKQPNRNLAIKSLVMRTLSVYDINQVEDNKQNDKPV